MPESTSTDYSEVIERLEEAGELWQPRMGLSHFEIDHHYLDVGSSMLLGTHPRNHPGQVRCGAYGDGGFTAFVETRWNYQYADVYYCLPACITWSDERLEKIVVHEYSHILCAPEQYLLDVKLQELAAEEEMTTTDFDALAALYYERMEMATENVARAVWGAWNDGS